MRARHPAQAATAVFAEDLVAIRIADRRRAAIHNALLH